VLLRTVTNAGFYLAIGRIHSECTTPEPHDWNMLAEQFIFNPKDTSNSTWPLCITGPYYTEADLAAGIILRYEHQPSHVVFTHLTTPRK